MDTGLIQEHNSINRIKRYRGYSSIMGYIFIEYRDKDTGGTEA